MIHVCKSCGKEFERRNGWQLNCVPCWNRCWGGLPSSEETRALILIHVGTEFESAQDFVNRTRMPPAAVWPVIVMLAGEGSINVATYLDGRCVRCGRGPYGGEAMIRRRQAA